MSGKTKEGARPRRSKLTPHEQRIRWAADGDVEQLYHFIATTPWDMVADMESVFTQLLKAITVRAERDPAAFAAETVTRMIGFNTYLLMRSQMYINLRLGQHGRSTRALGRPDFSLAAVEPLINGLLELQAAVAETLQAQAATARAYELVRAKRIENDRATAVKVGAGQRVRNAHAREDDGQRAADGNGRDGDRVGGFLGGPGPQTNGVVHDGQDDDIPHA
jgi:hypothetical protein